MLVSVVSRQGQGMGWARTKQGEAEVEGDDREYAKAIRQILFKFG